MTESAETFDAAASPPAERLSAGLITAVLAGLAAAWIAAGDAGLLHHALRHALMWVTMLAAVVACWPRGLRAAIWMATGAVAAVALTVSPLVQVNVMAAPVLLAGLALSRTTGGDRRTLTAAAQAAAIFGIYRVAVTSVPAVWMATDSLGSALGRVGGALAGRPLSVGATFAGLDVLVLAGAFYGLWLAATPGPRLRRGLVVAAAAVVGHLAYLVLVARAADLAAALPVPPADPNKMYTMPSDIPPWSFWPAVATLVPWNLVAVAGILQLIVIGAMLRWCRPPEPAYERRGWRRLAAGIALLAAVATLPLATWLYTQPAWLAEHGRPRKIVVNEEGFLNWLRPKHGDYGYISVGMYGMLSDLVAGYGGTLVRTTEFSADELKDADAVLLIYPDKPWKPGQLERIWKYVDGGGSLLVMAEHTIDQPSPGLDQTAGPSLPPRYKVVSTGDLAKDTPEIGRRIGPDAFVVLTPEGEVLAHSLAATEDEAARRAHLHRASRFNDALFPTAIRVNYDCAEWAIGGWLGCYEAMAHPTTAWSRDDRNDFGVVIGASLSIQSPARPLIMGKWGYGDIGDPSRPPSMIGNVRYDAGERLGDVCLAAEQPFGRGKVVVFGDTSSLINGINVGSYGYTSGLLSYVAGKAEAPSPPAQILGLLAALAAITLLAMRPAPGHAGLAAVVSAVVFASCFGLTHEANTPLPDGRGPGTTPIAYIDMSHLEAFSQEGMRDDGILGLELTFMRNGYLARTMTDFDGRALQQASIFISVAPLRPFTAGEREDVRRFVENGGLFIATVGWDARQGSEKLLADFGLRVGQPGRPRQEPSPCGFFKAPFINVRGENHYVRFYAGWPVSADDLDAPVPGQPPKTTALAYYPGNLPVILMRPVGEKGGKVVLIGDTGFAMNKNLEHMDGSPFEGMRENADFWRWFLSYVGAGPEWLPPPSAPPEPEVPLPVQAVPAATDTGGQAASATQTAAPTESGVTP